MDLTYKQEIGVGGIVLVGTAVFILGLFWLSGRSITEPEHTLDVVFETVGGLKQGDPVLVSGVRRGRVARVHLERVGRVIATIELTEDVQPRVDASAVVLSQDFFGAKFVDYNPGSADQLLPPGKAIAGSSPREITAVAGDVATRANELLGNVSSILSKQTAADLHNTLVAVERALNTLSEGAKGPFVQQTTQTLQTADRVLSRFDSLLGGGTGNNIDSLSANLALLTNHLGAASATLDSVLTDMRRGQGTLGRMASDTMLYDNLSAMLASLNALLVDMRERPGRYLTVKVF